MNGVQNKRKEVKKIREQMTDEELFLSKVYQESLGKFARVLGGKFQGCLYGWESHLFECGEPGDGTISPEGGKDGKP